MTFIERTVSSYGFFSAEGQQFLGDNVVFANDLPGVDNDRSVQYDFTGTTSAATCLYTLLEKGLP